MSVDELYSTISKKFQEKKLKLDNKNKDKISYWEIGNGNNLIVFIHGIANSKYFWYDLINELPVNLFQNYTALLIDLPGHGNSSEPQDFDHRISSYANIVFDFLQKYKQKNSKKLTSIVGHSLGGATATILAYNDKKIKHIICLEPTIAHHDPDIVSIYQNIPIKLWKLAYPIFKLIGSATLKYSFDNTDHKLMPIFRKEFEKMKVNVIPLGIRSLVEFSYNDFLKKIFDELPMEKHLIYGAFMVQRGLWKIPNYNDTVNIHAIEGASHTSYVDKPQEIAKLINKIIS